MVREQVRGAMNKVKGAFKDAVGKGTGNKKMQAEGKIDKAKVPLKTLRAMRRTRRAARPAKSGMASADALLMANVL